MDASISLSLSQNKNKFGSDDFENYFVSRMILHYNASTFTTESRAFDLSLSYVSQKHIICFTET